MYFRIKILANTKRFHYLRWDCSLKSLIQDNNKGSRCWQDPRVQCLNLPMTGQEVKGAWRCHLIPVESYATLRPCKCSKLPIHDAIAQSWGGLIVVDSVSKKSFHKLCQLLWACLCEVLGRLLSAPSERFNQCWYWFWLYKLFSINSHSLQFPESFVCVCKLFLTFYITCDIF